MMLLATSSGMAIASTAMLPSSFAMTCVTAASAATLRGEHGRACVACVAAVVFGWPFSGIATVPFGLCAVHAIGFGAVFGRVVAATAISAAISVACDTYMYNDISRSGGWKIVSSVYNLLKYNVASGKSDLYGTESATFYAKNLALNFQLAAALAIFAPFAVALAVAVKALRMRKLLKTKKCDAKTALAEIRAYRNNWRAMIAVCSPFPIVTAFFTWIPHKEERFLYMIYPCLCLSAAITVGALAESALGLNAHAFGKSRVVKLGVVVGVCGCVLTAMVLSLSRTAALLQYYGAPAKIYHALPMPSSRANGNAWPAWLAEEFAAGGDDATVDVCVGDEWYRFPSSYHFPSNKYRLRFPQGWFRRRAPDAVRFLQGWHRAHPRGLERRQPGAPKPIRRPFVVSFPRRSRIRARQRAQRLKRFRSGRMDRRRRGKVYRSISKSHAHPRLLHPRILGEEERVRRLQTQTPRARADFPDGRVRRRLHPHPDRS